MEPIDDPWPANPVELYRRMITDCDVELAKKVGRCLNECPQPQMVSVHLMQALARGCDSDDGFRRLLMPALLDEIESVEVKGRVLGGLTDVKDDRRWIERCRSTSEFERYMKLVGDDWTGNKRSVAYVARCHAEQGDVVYQDDIRLLTQSGLLAFYWKIAERERQRLACLKCSKVMKKWLVREGPSQEKEEMLLEVGESFELIKS